MTRSRIPSTDLMGVECTGTYHLNVCISLDTKMKNVPLQAGLHLWYRVKLKL